MKLKLTIEQSADPQLEGQYFDFGVQGGSLGRSADNDWVLPDPRFYTSGTHARVVFQDGSFVLTDTSTNGTFHNSPEKLIGKNRTVSLADGDRLFVGEFVLAVSIEEDLSTSTGTDDQSDFGAPVEGAGDTDGWSGEPMDDGWPADENPDEEFWPETSKEDADQDREASREQVSRLPWEQSSSSDSLMAVDEDFLADDQSSKRGFSGSDFQQSPEKEYFSPPKTGKEAGDAIPDDWDDLLTGFFEPPGEALSDESSEESSDDSSKDLSRESANRESSEEAFSSPPDGPSSEFPERDGGDFPDNGDFPDEEPPQGSPRDFPPAPEPKPSSEPRPVPKPAPRASAPRPRASRTGQNDPVARIMEELGIGDAAGDVDPEQFAEEIGKVVRLLGEGLMQLLASRAEIKNEFRIDQTRIAQVDNNPLKFSPTIEEAMRRIFVQGDSGGFTGGAASFEQALNDLRAHQIAILSAVQGSIESAIRQFNPEQLEQKLKKISPISAAAPWIRDAKCWNLFTVHYDEVAGRLRDDAKRVFIQEFAEAYERSSQEIARQIREGREKPES